MNNRFIKPRKRFGQHFLHDKYVINKIIAAINPQADSPVVEIGPGRGALTVPLLASLKRLDVVEIDRDLVAGLQDLCSEPDKLRIHQADALSFDFTALHKEKIKVIGNLPYNISTPLLFHLLDQSDGIEEMLFMVQKEVADRICAATDTRDYGRLSVMIQARCEVENLFPVSSGAFTPPPQVESAVIRIKPGTIKRQITNYPLFESLVKEAFTYRRKTLRNALRQMVTEEQFIRADITPTSRPQNLSIDEFATLADIVHADKNQ